MSNPQVEGVRLTKRICRYCRAEYRAPRGERWHACRDCAPTLWQAIEQAEREQAEREQAATTGKGIPF